MLYLYFGDDPSALQKQVDLVKNAFKKNAPSGLNIVSLDNENTVSDIAGALKNRSLFGALTLVVVKDFIKKIKKADADALVTLVEKHGKSKTANALFLERKVDKKRRPYKAFKKHASIKEYPLPKESEIKQRISATCKERGYAIDAQAQQKLAFSVGQNLVRLSNELDKLCAYSRDSKTITEEDIDALIPKTTEETIFVFIEYVAKNDFNKALSLFNENLKKGENIPYIVSMIAYQFRNMLLIKSLQDEGRSEQEILSEVRMHPFVFNKTKVLAENFSVVKLKQIYKYILVLDSTVKSNTKSEDAFQSFLVSIR
ncbi:DNA polymerase III subunit delta [Patescibacteria group bacterium]|nr:DNA polymerase III subunit delta [Patescibacteria group bacterium]